jgi:hypothetical protein
MLKLESTIAAVLNLCSERTCHVILQNNKTCIVSLYAFSHQVPTGKNAYLKVYIKER